MSRRRIPLEIDIRGKVGIVTGSGRGIGREIACTLAREGVTTVVTDINQEYLDDVAQEFESQGWAGSQYLCDVRDFSQIERTVNAVVDEHGRIDILVNNAGVAHIAQVDALSEELWDLSQDVNLKGAFLMCKAVGPVMKEQKSGRIINASSFAAIIPTIGGGAYASSKIGVASLTRVLAGELGPWNVTVNCYAPGMIPTEMNHFADAPQEKQDQLLDTLTLRRWGEKSDVANLICFLSSDLAGYITGTMIDVSGGKLATQNPRIAYQGGPSGGTYGI